MKQARMQTLLLLITVGVPIGASAQTSSDGPAYPTKPIRLVVPFAPGGTTDIQARMLGEKLAQRLGQPVVIDNRPGAGGNVGMGLVAQAPADGYTIVLNTVGSWATTPHLSNLPYNVLEDFAPIIHVSTIPGVLAVHPSLPVTTVKELIALGKRKPGEINYGSAGLGGFSHMAAELFSVMTKIRMTHVPYKSSGAGLIDLIGGHIQVLFGATVSTVPHVKSGKVRALATTGAERVAILPHLPTIAEAGVPGYENSTWTAIGAPARTPKPIIERLNGELNGILQIPDIRKGFAAAAATITGGTPEQFHEFLKSEFTKFGKLVKEAGIKAAMSR